nr:hypothetical protein [uncultured Caulobacter sp.]
METGKSSWRALALTILRATMAAGTLDITDGLQGWGAHGISRSWR